MYENDLIVIIGLIVFLSVLVIAGAIMEYLGKD